MRVQVAIQKKVNQMEEITSIKSLISKLRKLRDKNLIKMNNLNFIYLAFFHYFLNPQTIVKFKSFR